MENIVRDLGKNQYQINDWSRLDYFIEINQTRDIKYRDYVNKKKIIINIRNMYLNINRLTYQKNEKINQLVEFHLL